MAPFSAQVLSLLHNGSQPAPAIEASGAQQASANGAAAGAVSFPLVGLGEWLLELLTSAHPIRSNVWLRRALVECPVSDIRRDFALLLSRAIGSLLRPTAARNASTAASAVPMQVSPPDESAAALASTASKLHEEAQNKLEAGRLAFAMQCPLH